MGRKYAKSLANPSIAVAYIRVSTEEQHLGPEAQRKQIEKWAAGEEVTVAAWCVDQGVSGAAGIDQRPGFAQALYELRKHHAGWLVVAKRDRLARSVKAVVAIETAVEASGARLASADGSPTGDEPTEVFQRQILDSVAQLERGFIRTRTKAALAVKRERRERIGTIPYGFRLATDGRHHEPRRCDGGCLGCLRLEESPEEQRTVERARELRDRKVTLRGIASMLDLEGFKTRVGTAFTHVQVSKMLGRPPTPKPKAPEPPKPPQPLSESFQSWRGR